MKSCISCSRARKPVLDKHKDRVGCSFASRYEEFEEIIIDLGEKKGDNYVYHTKRPNQKGKGVMRMIPTVSVDFKCRNYKE